MGTYETLHSKCEKLVRRDMTTRKRSICTLTHQLSDSYPNRAFVERNAQQILEHRLYVLGLNNCLKQLAKMEGVKHQPISLGITPNFTEQGPIPVFDPHYSTL